jgi:hypothetical protein
VAWTVVSAPAWAFAGATRAAPTGPAYSILLVAHVLCAVVGFGAVGLTGVQAWRARRGPDAPGAEAVRRYFRPGVNWAARLVYAVPVLGFVLLATSHGAYDAGDTWVIAGLVVWLAAAGGAELVVWPGERRIQQGVAGDWDRHLARTCVRVTAAAAGLAVCFVVATVLMVGKP